MSSNDTSPEPGCDATSDATSDGGAAVVTGGSAVITDSMLAIGGLTSARCSAGPLGPGGFVALVADGLDIAIASVIPTVEATDAVPTTSRARRAG